jgi:hypothetical protein
VITGNTVDGQSEFAEQLTKMLISAGTVILDQVAGDDDKVRMPIGFSIVLEDGIQRRIGGGAAQIPPGVGEKVRICEMQYPQSGRCAVDV